MSYVDIIITVAILAIVLFAAHRNGQANPVGTGKLAKRLSAVELKVAEQGEKLDSLDQMMVSLQATAAATATAVAAMRVELGGDRVLAERTWKTVDRLQNYFIEDAFKQRSGR